MGSRVGRAVCLTKLLGPSVSGENFEKNLLDFFDSCHIVVCLDKYLGNSIPECVVRILVWEFLIFIPLSIVLTVVSHKKLLSHDIQHIHSSSTCGPWWCVWTNI